MSIEYLISALPEPIDVNKFSYIDLVDISTEFLNEKDVGVFSYLIFINDLYNSVHLRFRSDSFRSPSNYSKLELSSILERRQGSINEFLDSYLKQGYAEIDDSKKRELELFELGKKLFEAILVNDLEDLNLSSLNISGRDFLLRYLGFILEFKNTSVLTYNSERGKALPLGQGYALKQKNQDFKLDGELYWFKELEPQLQKSPMEAEKSRLLFISNWLETIPEVGGFHAATTWAYAIRLLESEKLQNLDSESGKTALNQILNNLLDGAGGIKK